nr:hypothetical protein [Allomuricauda sp.]
MRKLRASTLMETLVATVLIVVIFMVSSMVLNNLFATSIALNENRVRQELMRLQYRHQNKQLKLPYYAELEDWEVQVSEVIWQSTKQTRFLAKHRSGKKEIVLNK